MIPLITAIMSLPVAAKLLGFTASGIKAGTLAALFMSKWATLFGSVGAGTPVAILQWIGTWKLSTAAMSSVAGIAAYFGLG